MDFLYESDLSLFGGELLVDPPPATAELWADQDGIKSISAAPWQPPKATLQLQGMHSDGQQSVEQDSFEQGWLDTKVDLLDLLTDDGQVSSILFPQIAPYGVSVPEIEAARSGDDLDLSCVAVEVMKSIAEEAAQQLEEETTLSAKLLESLVDSMDMDDTFDDIVEAGLDLPILSPVSAEDIDSILSSDPVSPSTSSSDTDTTITSDSSSITSLDFTSLSIPEAAQVTGDLALLLQTVEKEQHAEPIPLSESAPQYQVNKKRARPYERPTIKTESAASIVKEGKLADRKLRKKQQNKDAATRYRQKKKVESDSISSDSLVLETRNVELKDQVETMTREISYLKNLLIEIYQAKGLAIPGKIK